MYLLRTCKWVFLLWLRVSIALADLRFGMQPKTPFPSDQALGIQSYTTILGVLTGKY